MSEELIKRLAAAANAAKECGEYYRADLLRDAADALSRLAPAVQVPEGMVLVPVEPTDWMIGAGIEAYDGKCESSYRAMLAAAPAPAPAPVAVPEGDGWMPIETAPKDGSWIVAFRPTAPAYGDSQIVICRTTACKSFAWDGGDNYTDRANTPTHWMPLPPAPAATKKEEE